MIRGVPETVLVAPDAFKGTFSAAEVAAAIGAGLADAGRTVDLCPAADGGEGTAAALAAARGGGWRTARVRDPLGRPVEARFALDGSRAYLDTAAASGLHLVVPDERDPVAASTAGTGELILAAVAAGADTVVLGVGGSATSDGGVGALEAIADGGGLGGARLVVLCDVRTAYEDAAVVFGPQKGADPATVERLTARLHARAAELPRDPSGRPMSGAAGGLSGALWAVHGAELVAGAPYVLDALGFDARMRAARCVVTGEGALDASSLSGKLVSEVATRARQAGVPCSAVCGRRELDPMGARILDLERILEASSEAELRAAGRTLGELV